MKKLPSMPTALFVDTWRGLVQRRLWPVAVALLVALVAVPLLLDTDSESAAPPPPDPASASAELAAEPLVAVASADERDAARRVLGARKDPFRPAVVPKREAAGDGAPSTDARADGVSAGSSSVDSATAGGSPVTGSGGDTASIVPAPPTPTPQPETTSKSRKRPPESLTVRWGTHGDEPLEKLEVERLDPLSTPEGPVLVYLGLTDDGRSATFMVGPDTTVEGDGRCRPNREDCRTFELMVGDTELLDVADEGGTRSRYRLDLVDIHGGHATPDGDADAKARAERRAKRALRHVSPTYRFDAATGTLERTDGGD